MRRQNGVDAFSQVSVDLFRLSYQVCDLVKNLSAMTKTSLFIRLCNWPHTLWVCFLSGMLVSWTVTILYDSFLTENGNRVMIVAWGFLCSSGAMIELPASGHKQEDAKSVFRRRLRWLFGAIFISLMTFAFVFMTLSSSEPGNEGKLIAPHSSNLSGSS